VEDDYRNARGSYDAFVSVGMLEHVGLENYETLGRVIDRCLHANGRGLVHSIARPRSIPMNRWIERRIFPGSYCPTLSEMARLLEPWNLGVLDVENLRLHYARTLEHWLERFEKNADFVRARFDERFVRTWRLYLAGSIAAFLSGSFQLFQMVFARAASRAIPWTREYLYTQS
jgi:cyclopropane-fatty-acyl-phospholipid synthase